MALSLKRERDLKGHSPMSPLRILIADQQHTQRLLIEKSLNLLGQYCIAPVASYAELDLLTQSSELEFDLVVVRGALTLVEGVDAAAFCLNRACIRNALIYGDDYLLLHGGLPARAWGTLMMARAADLHTLTRVLHSIAWKEFVTRDGLSCVSADVVH